MKKMIILACLLFLAACSDQQTAGGNEDIPTEVSEETQPALTMDSFIGAFESEGITVDREEKPAFGMISAIDGIIFYNGNDPVKIYEFDSEETITYAEENFPFMANWDRNGLFVLETSNQQAKDIFNTVE